MANRIITEFSDLISTMDRQISAIRGGNRAARKNLRELVSAVIDENDITWLSFLVDGVTHYWEHNLNKDKHELSFIRDLKAIEAECFDESAGHLENLRAKLHEARQRFGVTLLMLWGEGLAKSIQESHAEDGSSLGTYLGKEGPKDEFPDDDSDDTVDEKDPEQNIVVPDAGELESNDIPEPVDSEVKDEPDSDDSDRTETP